MAVLMYAFLNTLINADYIIFYSVKIHPVVKKLDFQNASPAPE